ncbi:hypothetical protein PV10_01611 [Exophiala mesophila]|uniref:Uncharacterized protein n=1 Tax=Exophiala mesophila TaxID=212818 RepID=A0A0D1YBA4_EXOME|nr:uncharacterized protein PV10_01611 [Exophiala mesophila]KIV97911.1 hypothetical protein PV10_01611 [Exophiala mesophila]
MGKLFGKSQSSKVVRETPDGPNAPPTFEASTQPPEFPPFSTSFASVSLHRTDRIRLLQFPLDEIEGVRTVIQRFWPKGIQDERIVNNSHEFKLNGNPWTGNSSSEKTPSRIVMREILAQLFSRGWILMVSTNISKNEYDQDTMFFRKQLTPPPPSEWIAISFNRKDRLRLIGAPQEVIAGFTGVLQRMNLFLDGQLKDQQNNMYEFRCTGHPWKAMAEETMTTRQLFLKMLETLERHGFSLYASLNQNNGDEDDSQQAESWYCVRDRDWVENKPVFHR